MRKANGRVFWLLAAILAFPMLSSAQSLGSVAKKERSRREKNKEKGVVSREFTEEEVFGESKKAEDEETEGEETEAAGEGDGDASAIPSPLPDPDGAKAERGAKDPDQESRDRRRSEAELRSRMQQARAKVSVARERVQFFSELYLAQGERYVDENGNTVVSAPEELQRLTKRAKEDLAAAEKGVTDLQEQARREGVPPGWLR
jgi:hypothetical protein